MPNFVPAALSRSASASHAAISMHETEVRYGDIMSIDGVAGGRGDAVDALRHDLVAIEPRSRPSPRCSGPRGN